MKAKALLLPITVLFLLSGLNTVKAQQFTKVNQHLYEADRYNLAAFDFATTANVYFNYQLNNLGVEDNPRSFLVGLGGKPFKKQQNMAMGLRMMTEKRALLVNNLSIQLQYAYNLIQKGSHHFSIGTSMGYLQEKVKYNEMTIVDLGLVKDLDRGNYYLDAQLGFNYRYIKDRFELKASSNLAHIPALFSQEVSPSITYFPILTSNLSTAFYIGDWGVEPLLMYTTNIGAALHEGNFALGTRFSYKNWAWIGGAAHNDKQYHVAIGVNPFSFHEKMAGVNIFGSMDVNAALGSSIEFGIGYQIGKPYMHTKSKQLRPLPLYSDSQALTQRLANYNFQFEEFGVVLIELDYPTLSYYYGEETDDFINKDIDLLVQEIATVVQQGTEARKKDRLSAEIYQLTISTSLVEILAELDFTADINYNGELGLNPEIHYTLDGRPRTVSIQSGPISLHEQALLKQLYLKARLLDTFEAKGLSLRAEILFEIKTSERIDSQRVTTIGLVLVKG